MLRRSSTAWRKSTSRISRSWKSTARRLKLHSLSAGNFFFFLIFGGVVFSLKRDLFMTTHRFHQYKIISRLTCSLKVSWWAGLAHQHEQEAHQEVSPVGEVPSVPGQRDGVCQFHFFSFFKDFNYFKVVILHYICPKASLNTSQDICLTLVFAG